MCSSDLEDALAAREASEKRKYSETEIIALLRKEVKNQCANLDSILKSRDITLPTKVCLVKAMVFPVVMYGCERWTVKKAEIRKIDAFEM